MKVLLVHFKEEDGGTGTSLQQPVALVKMSEDISVLNDTLYPNDCCLDGPVALVQVKELNPLNPFVIYFLLYFTYCILGLRSSFQICSRFRLHWSFPRRRIRPHTCT